MRKNKILFGIINLLSVATFLLLLIFVVPNKIPLLSNFYNEIILIGSKWFLFVGITLEIIFSIIQILSNNSSKKFIFGTAAIICLYENMLAMFYFCTEKTFSVFEISKISISISLFLPISIFIFVYGAKIKHLPYKSRLGIYSKDSASTEFIWNHTHLFSSNAFMMCGLILFVISVIFAFFTLNFVELALFLLLIILTYLLCLKQAFDMNKKRIDMQKKLDSQKNNTEKK